MGSSQKASLCVIGKNMPIMEIVTLIPEAKTVLAEYGLHCFSCAGSQYELLGEGCATHGFSGEEIDALVDDLNDMLERMPTRPETLTLTRDAARAIRKIAKEDPEARTTLKKTTIGLAVIADASGGFCMEFRPKPERGEKAFGHPEEPSVSIFASALTLRRIGGAVIDFREGRFKLDLAEDAPQPPCDCSHGSCCHPRG